MINSGLKFKELLQATGRSSEPTVIDTAEVKRARFDITMTPERASSMLKDGEHAIVQYVSTLSVDRDGDIVVPSGCDLSEFKKAPSVFWGHDYGQPPIGSDAEIGVDDRGVWAKTVYANTERGNEIWQLRKDGHLRTSSIGFIPLKTICRGDEDFDKELASIPGIKEIRDVNEGSKKCRRIIKQWLMLEHSDVGVPANPDALTIAVAKNLRLTPWDVKSLIEEIYTPIPIADQKPFPNEHAARIQNPDDFVSIVQLWERDGIRGLGGQLKSDPNGATHIQTLRFNKDKWSAEEAKKWLDAHDYKPISFEAASGTPDKSITRESVGKTMTLVRTIVPRKMIRREIDMKTLVLESINRHKGKVDVD